MTFGCRAILLVSLFAAACAAEGEEPGTPDASSGPDSSVASGAIRGTVRDASTDRPVAGAEVSTGALGAISDATGAFGVAPLAAGPLKLRAYRRGFVPDSVTAIVTSGVTSLIDFSLVPAEPPCCRLDGVWSASFVLDSAGLNARPSSREASGELVFDGSMTDPGPADNVFASTAESRIDFGRMLGADQTSAVDGEGLVFGGDSVAITVVPRFADWGVELLGRFSADTIRGIWYQRASCCGAYGTFTLIRTAEAD
ncbi:MAG: carboxypeptidase-like regulatory domain-containing protein [Gemmatimonadota bacterium]|nr:carboxypeptidase-like regulatory domain-containing protein [Gemmatimonadota bacterium]MDH3428044.1 carboxypeptidase-like regulatory domain-containing protein [Gemmatimonadota bacterium]